MSSSFMMVAPSFEIVVLPVEVEVWGLERDWKKGGGESVGMRWLIFAEVSRL